MRTTFITAALGCLSLASAYYWVGERQSDSDLVLSHSEHFEFVKDKARLVHINTCREYDFKIHQIEVSTHRGRTVNGRLIEGGPGSFYAIVELYGDKEATFQLKVWGAWNKERQVVDSDKDVKFFDNKWPCSHEVY